MREFVESKTAEEPGWEIFNEILASIEKGEAEEILAWYPRLARNSIDGGRIIYLIDTGKITVLKFPIFWFDPTLLPRTFPLRGMYLLHYRRNA